jgi:hypothetical protein
MPPEATVGTLVGSTPEEVARKESLAELLRHAAIPDSEMLDNLGLFLTRQTLSRINFMQRIYELIVPVHGVLMEFGVRWGQNLALFSSFRGICEPYNYNRRIIGFDTFSGFPAVSIEDRGLKPGDYTVAKDWVSSLEAILSFHGSNAPIAHKRKFERVQGDATGTLPTFLQEHPETIITLAYFDFDLYRPTKVCLETILPHLTKGSVLAFDELDAPQFPGETAAVREVLGLSRYAIRRDPSRSSPLTSYLVID